MSTERRSILFVDDDAVLLEGLQNVLHRDRARWDMHFAPGGEAALELLRTRTFDVVVSDMRMPMIDGAMLFRILRAEAPQTVRIMLTGSECESAAADIHELLPKPCSAATLRAALERAIAGLARARRGTRRSLSPVAMPDP